jgi:hypothetical protein
MLMGPWNHGGFCAAAAISGSVNFGSKTGVYREA